MARTELDDIKKLSPRERLARLKELENKRRKEMEEARQLIDASEMEIEIEEELKQIPIPQVKAVDIRQLFTPEEKQMFRMKRYVSKQPEEDEESEAKPLEETVQEEAARHQVEASVVQYGDALEEAQRLMQNTEQIRQVYDTIKDLTHKASAGMYMTKAEEHQLESYADMFRSLYDSRAEFVAADPGAEDMLSAAGRMLYDARLK